MYIMYIDIVVGIIKQKTFMCTKPRAYFITYHVSHAYIRQLSFVGGIISTTSGTHLEWSVYRKLAIKQNP